MKKSKSNILSVSIFRYFNSGEFAGQYTYVYYSSGRHRVISGLDLPQTVVAFKTSHSPARVSENIYHTCRLVYYFYC